MGTPFIKLLRSPNSGYCYDVGKNEILRIDDNLYQYLAGILEDNPVEVDEETTSLFDELREAGYLSDKRPEVIRHPYTDLLPLFLERKIEKITLQLTQDCNFRCKYCIYSEEINTKQRIHSQKNMTWETAKKAIDFYLDHSVDSLKRNVGFYGGEPLLQFELLKRVVEYSKERLKGKPLSFTITTNGSLLTDKVVEFLDGNNINTLISLDGPKEVNDKNRVFKNGYGTYETVIDNINKIKKHYPLFYKKISINMVVDPNNDVDCINTVAVDLDDFNSNNISTNFIDNTDEQVVASNKFVMKSEYQNFLAYLSHFSLYPKVNLSPLGRNNLTTVLSDIQRFYAAQELPYQTAPGGPCVPGKNRLFINVDEELYPCERVNETGHMCIGTLDNGFDYKKAAGILNIGSLTTENCKNCWAIRHCNMCAKIIDTGSELSATLKLSYCPNTISLAEKKLRAMILMTEVPVFYKDQIKV